MDNVILNNNCGRDVDDPEFLDQTAIELVERDKRIAAYNGMVSAYNA